MPKDRLECRTLRDPVVAAAGAGVIVGPAGGLMPVAVEDSIVVVVVSADEGSAGMEEEDKMLTMVAEETCLAELRHPSHPAHRPRFRHERSLLPCLTHI